MPAGAPPAFHPPLTSLASASIMRRAMFSQMLFTLGNAFTVGTFFSYFYDSFLPSAMMFAIAQILPETAQACSLITRHLIRVGFRRKVLWRNGLTLARLAAIFVPFALWFPPDNSTVALCWILFWTAVWYVLQGISYVALISWLSDLVPEMEWGQLSSRRELASLAVGIVAPFAIGLIRRNWLTGQSRQIEQVSFAVLFIVGGLIVLTSTIPLASVPDVPVQPAPARTPVRRDDLRRNRPFWQLTASRWWGAIFQGLTQAAFFLFARRVLDIPIEDALLLACCGRLLQLPVTWLAGRLTDTARDKLGLACGLFIASCGVPFWILATPQRWSLLYFAYALWAGFGLVNVCGINLCLKLAPRSRNTAQLALYEQVSGLLAGLSGLVGGILLDRWLHQVEGIAPGWHALANTWNALWPGVLVTTTKELPYRVLFLISWCGRLLTPLWLLGLPQPPSRSTAGVVPVESQTAQTAPSTAPPTTT